MSEAEMRQVSDYCWEMPKTGDMRVPGKIFASKALLRYAQRDNTLSQVRNVAHLPGIVGYSLAMPDMHWGYGFPIGGVAATDPEDGGVISPGGIGYDINCGVRLMRSDLTCSQAAKKIPRLLNTLFAEIPSGVGSRSELRVSASELRKALKTGLPWAISQGYGIEEDIRLCESEGVMTAADPAMVSDNALKRGMNQLGTLGSGNHFIEIDAVEEVYDKAAAASLGLFLEQVVVMIHTGSRGLGYQVCDDYLVVMRRATKKYHVSLPDRQLSCAPLQTAEGQNYYAAMACAANFAWINRQIIMHKARKALEKLFSRSAKDLGLRLVYDVCHNIGKLEQHDVQGKTRQLLVHRKGATRAFGPGHKDIPAVYRTCGQPVLIPGDMGTASYVLVAQNQALQESWGSTCHGAGRMLSRSGARKKAQGRTIGDELKSRGIESRAHGRQTLAEEMPEAYKSIEEVVQVVEQAGLSHRVARLRPLAVMKG